MPTIVRSLSAKIDLHHFIQCDAVLATVVELVVRVDAGAAIWRTFSSVPLFSRYAVIPVPGKVWLHTSVVGADCSVSELGRADLLFAPAIDMPEPRAITRTIQRLERQWGGLLRDHHTRRRYLAANCSTTFLLAEAGLLNGKQATTSWWLADLFRRRYPEVQLLPDLVVKDKRIFTAAAYSAVLNLALESRNLLAREVCLPAPVLCWSMRTARSNHPTRILPRRLSMAITWSSRPKPTSLNVCGIRQTWQGWRPA